MRTKLPTWPKSTVKQILLAAICLLTTSQLILAQKPTLSPNQNTPRTRTAQELKKLDGQIDDAFLRGDKMLLERVLADEMISVSPEGNVARKKEILNGISPPNAKSKLSITAEDVQVYLFGDTAIISSRKTMKENESKGARSDQYRDTNTYVRKHGRWQLIASQQSKLPAPYSAKEVQLNLDIDDALITGNRNAPVVLIEFVDYQCPICRGFAASTMKQIEADYINTGRIGFIVRQTPLEELHRYAFKAAEAAQCATAQGKFWEMHRALLGEPMTLTENGLLAHAQTLKLKMPKFRQCLADEKTAATLRQGMREALGLGLQGTPVFLIGIRKADENKVRALRLIEGAYPYEVFKAALDPMIKAQTP
ncbi:MAG: thioredoxin domain-containing protein [bacterium]